MTYYSRRTILAAAISSTVHAAGSGDSQYATAHKYGKLVLAASPDKDAFDSRSVDCPFVFQNDGLFYMTLHRVGRHGLPDRARIQLRPGPVAQTRRHLAA